MRSLKRRPMVSRLSSQLWKVAVSTAVFALSRILEEKNSVVKFDDVIGEIYTLAEQGVRKRNHSAIGAKR